MFSQLFGEYLVNENKISSDKLKEVLRKTSKERVKLGTIAVAEGYLTEKQADEINHLQATYDKRFGDIAVEKGYLDGEQVDYLLSHQGNPFMKFIQILFDEGCISSTELDWMLGDFQEQNGFTDADMDALKHEDIDQIVNLFAFASKAHVTDLTALLLRNITRFITDDYYIGHIERVDELTSSAMVMQHTFGDYSIYLGLAAADTDECFFATAAEYARDNYRDMSGLVYDSLSEFINTISGLFATRLSYEGITMDMEPPCAYGDQTVHGRAYVVPIYIHGARLNIYIAVDSELTFDKEPLSLNIRTTQGSIASEYSKGRIVIVDDSALARRVLREILENEGYTVVCEAVNGMEAIEVYKKYIPDIITLDITMPVMDGVEALRQIKDFDHDANAVMITAAGQEKKVIEAIRIGAGHFVVKPFQGEEVIKAIDSYFA